MLGPRTETRAFPAPFFGVRSAPLARLTMFTLALAILVTTVTTSRVVAQGASKTKDTSDRDVAQKKADAPGGNSSSASTAATESKEEKEESIEAVVTKVIDGDSIKAKDKEGKEYEIQIEGTDAPESKQAYGKEATEALRAMLADHPIRVTWRKKDNFERLLAQVYVGEKHINSDMIRDGHAWHFKRYNKSEMLAECETEAKTEKRGLWGTTNPQAPWDYRKENRTPDKPDR